MKRTQALAVATLVLLALGAVARWRWPSSVPTLDCAPEAVRVVDGVAVCGLPGEEPSAGQARTLGLKRDLNGAPEAELAALVGRSLARKLVEARQARGRFSSWAEVDALPGVGAARLKALQAALEIRQEARRQEAGR